MSKPKIEPRKVKSDDCVVYVGRQIDADQMVITDAGTPYYPHKGEWVEVYPLISVRQYIAWNKIRNMASGTDEGILMLCRALSDKIKEWNWTDLDGKKMPQPYKKPDVLLDLTEDELLWLSAALVETPGQRKNASAPSA